VFYFPHHGHDLLPGIRQQLDRAAYLVVVVLDRDLPEVLEKLDELA
jgi:hypothetical protein